MIQQVLQDFGLSENEVKVYLALLPMQRGCSSTIGNRAGMSRNTVRSVVRGLVKKGLAHEKTDRGTNFYTAESPEKLFHILEEQKTKISKKQADLNKFMGILQAMQNPALHCPSVEYYEGNSGIVEIYEDMVATGEDIFCWTDIQKIDETLGRYMQEFIKKRVEAGITTYTFMPENKMNVAYAAKNEEKRKTKLVKSLPIEGEIRIYGNKVAVITFDKTKPVGFVFKSGLISNMFRSIFKNSWGEES